MAGFFDGKWKLNAKTTWWFEKKVEVPAPLAPPAPELKKEDSAPPKEAPAPKKEEPASKKEAPAAK